MLQKISISYKLFSTLIIIKKIMFIEQQIGILERFLKGHVKLDTNVMMLKIQLASQK